MGICSSNLTAEEKQAMQLSKDIDKSNERLFEQDQQKIKLLLLGAGESGKSTIFKQMKFLYGVGFGDEEKKAMIPVIYNNTITSMKVLINAHAELGELDILAQQAKQTLLDTSDDATIDEKIGGAIKELWADPGIQDAFSKRSKFQLNDSADYYFKHVDRLMMAEYEANFLDILKSRVRTSGIVVENYNIDGVEFIMYDVGGQRNERKKWIYCFDDVTAVIFVASLSEYDQMLYEDNQQNRMTEAIHLFSEICNSRWFEKTSMILFLNKKDLFEEKIKRVDLNVFDPNYTHGCCSCGNGYPNNEDPCICGVQDLAKQFILQLFLEQNQRKDREIYHHCTCATDTQNVEIVFGACKTIILKNNLMTSGLMCD
eukprot:TRINITY_DN718_c0_g1_i1.p1 TRINITY_DN718_c0_g1~~TRINITY_DN718_c0_g1_i1.p1  ORF type:complete len:371 (-),score=71.29 TRINITY_DN718_c0_g1_i1:290-1402(-)